MKKIYIVLSPKFLHLPSEGRGYVMVYSFLKAVTEKPYDGVLNLLKSEEALSAEILVQFPIFLQYIDILMSIVLKFLIRKVLRRKHWI